MYDVKVSALFRWDPVMFWAYSRMISDIIASAPLLLPDGDICTLNVWYESVGSIHLISSSEVMLLPAVRWIDAGIVSDMSRELFPPFHCQESKNQKHFCKFKAPPVQKSSLSQCWARSWSAGEHWGWRGGLNGHLLLPAGQLCFPGLRHLQRHLLWKSLFPR